MILKQKAFQKLAQIMKLKENQNKKSHIPVSNPNLTKIRCAWSEQFNADTTRSHCRRYQKCYNLYSTSESDKLVASKLRREIL